MSSTRRVRIGNKRFAKSNEESLEKDGSNASKNKGRKRKLTDMLGCQWSKEELEHFYDAYRKHGKDWKKVAGAIRNRSTDMVEALYNMNKAYLSLPDGTATAAGLIAMMIDHYNILEGSDSEQEDNDGSRTSTKFQKRGCGKLRGNSSKGSAGRYPDLLQLQSSPSSFGFLSSKNKRTGDFAGGQPRAVGKRTPRFAVSSTHEKNDGNKIVSPKRKSLKFGRDIGGDDEGAHVAAMALAEAFQRGGSPQVSRTPGSKADIHNCERKYSESEVAYSKVNIHMDDGPECSLGSREAENDDFIRSTSHQLDSGSAGTVATEPKRRKLKGKKSMPGADNHFDDAREACSGTEEEISARNVKDETEVELCQGGPPSSDWVRKRSQHHFFGDENLALDALQTLADLSLNMLLPSSTVESESSAQVKEENKIDSSRPTTNEKVYRNNQRERGKCYCNKRKPQPSVVGAETVKRKTSKSRTLDVNVSFEAKQEAEQSVNKIQKRKRKAPSAKFSEVEVHPGNTLDTSQKIKTTAEDEKQCTAKTKRPSQFSPLSKQIKSTKASECSTSRTELGKAAAEAAEVVPQVFSKSNLSTKSKNRRKLSLQKAMLSREPRSSEGAGENHLDKHTTNEETMDLTEKLSHSLLSPLLRRWCTYEWFYSAIDYPWFAKLEFDDYLNHVGLGHVPRLTRVEWGVIRSSLGKPRRLSQQFLREERQKLEQYRESVRTHYTELRAGTRDGLPTDLARPLSVGQRVIACHPKTREIHDGSILTVDRNRCRVQFDRPELGVEFVMDIDCMPLDPFENIPDALRKRNLVSDLLFEGLNERKPYDYLKGWKGEGPIASRENVETADEPARCSVSDYSMNKLIKHAEEDTIDDIVQARAAANEVALATHQALYSQPCTMSQIQAKEEDIRALAHMTRALDKKGALLIELRQMNEEVASKQNEGEPIRDIENFRKQYGMVLLQLRDANDLIASTLVYLRQRNTFIRNSTHPPMGSVDNSSVPAGPLKESALPNRDSGSHTLGIVETSKCKARAMVDVAVQALISQKEGKNSVSRVTEALDSGKLYSGADPGVPGVKSFQSNEPGHGISTQQEPISSCISDPTTANGARDVEPNQIRSANETQFPSELISSCVSTLLMIQSCTERQYPPAEVAQILESAVTTLLPCCSENLPIYREIEACMSAIKNQMLALIPTPTTNTPTENSVM